MTAYAARVRSGNLRRWLRPEPVRAAALAIVLLAGTAAAAALQDRARPLDAVVVIAILLACAAWSARRTRPATTALVVAAVVAGYLVLGGPYGPIQLVVSLCCITVGARCRTPRAVAVGSAAAVVLGAGLATRLTWSSPLPAVAVLVAWAVVFVALPLMVGILLRVRAEAASRQRTELLARGAEAERLRLAREVHDIAGHGFSVVCLQAGVALTVFDEQPGQARRCVEVIRESAEVALRDLHGMLAALRCPAPGVADVPELVDRVRAAGLPVELRSLGDPADARLDDEVSTTVHRVVQESLTNVLRHAGPTVATVEITHHPDAVSVVVRDRGTGLAHAGTSSGGNGLGGLRARAESLGGTLSVTDRPAGGVEVEARLPRRPQP